MRRFVLEGISWNGIRTFYIESQHLLFFNFKFYSHRDKQAQHRLLSLSSNTISFQFRQSAQTKTNCIIYNSSCCRFHARRAHNVPVDHVKLLSTRIMEKQNHRYCAMKRSMKISRPRNKQFLNIFLPFSKRASPWDVLMASACLMH